jgi:hypothetical protein
MNHPFDDFYNPETASTLARVGPEEREGKITFKTEGDNGKNGRRGKRGEDGHCSSGSGRDGEDGGPSAPGGPGGNIDICIYTLEHNPGRIHIRGYMTESGERFRIDEVYASPLASSIALISEAGRGGNGANAGNGGDGAEGCDGLNANRNRVGGNGGSGGDGGNGGNGSAGSNGGNGGDITVRCLERDLHLLMLLETPLCLGGAAGDSGQGGQGGTAASGGQGGNEFVYYTSSTTWDGKTTTETTHKNGAGYSGRTGTAGRPGVSQGPGLNGEPGTYCYLVTSSATQEIYAYPTRYDLRLAAFVPCVPLDDDGVIEPGERVDIPSLAVTNVGSMPSPHQGVYFTLPPTRFLTMESGRLDMPYSLAPDTTAHVDQGLISFAIDVILADKLNVKAELRVKATVCGVDKSFANFVPYFTPVRIEYPLKIESVRLMSSIAAGSTSRVFICVQNVSNRDYGLDSDSQRAIGCLVSVKEDGHFLALVEDEEAPQLLDQERLLDVPRVAALSSIVLERHVHLDLMSNPGERLNVSFNLALGGLATPRNLEAVQHDVRHVTSAFVFGQHANPGILVVLSSSVISRPMIDHWNHVGEVTGEAVDFWDLSLYGQMDLHRRVPEAGNRTLMEIFRGKTIVLLQHHFAVPGSHPPIPCSTLDFLHTEQYQEARCGHDIRVLLGFHRALPVNLFDFDYLAVPRVAETVESRSPADFKAALKISPKTYGTMGVQVNLRVPSKMFTLHSSESLARHAFEDVNKHLKRHFPQREYFVTMAGGKDRATYSAGKIAVRRGLDKVHCSTDQATHVAGPLCFVFQDVGEMGKEELQQIVWGLHDNRLIASFHCALDKMSNGDFPEHGDTMAEALKRVVWKRLKVEHDELRRLGGRSANALFMDLFAASFAGKPGLVDAASQNFVMDLVVKWKRYDAMHNHLLSRVLMKNKTHQASEKAWNAVLGAAFRQSASPKAGLRAEIKAEMLARSALWKKEVWQQLKGVKGGLLVKAKRLEDYVQGGRREGRTRAFVLVAETVVGSEAAFEKLVAHRAQADVRRIKMESHFRDAMAELTSSVRLSAAELQ